jgi:hypothetical protein
VFAQYHQVAAFEGTDWPLWVTPAVLCAVFAVTAAVIALRQRPDPGQRPVGVAGAVLSAATPMAAFGAVFVLTYRDGTPVALRVAVAVAWVAASWFTVGVWLTVRSERRSAATPNTAGTPASAAAATSGPQRGEVWFAVPPVVGSLSPEAMKPRPCIVLEASPSAHGVKVVSCTSQATTARRSGWPEMDSSHWGTGTDTTFLRTDMVALAPRSTFSKRLAVLSRGELQWVVAEVAKAAKEKKRR